MTSLAVDAACGLGFGVQPLDMLTFAAVTLVLGFTAAISIAAPAWRAAKIDPAITLRSQ